MSSETPGQIAYAAARQHDRDAVGWKELTQNDRDFWEAIADAARAPLVAAIRTFIECEVTYPMVAGEAYRDMLKAAGLW